MAAISTGANLSNLASMFSKKVDEKFTRQSQAALVTNNDYKFDGVKTVSVYSIGTAAMNDYNRAATDANHATHIFSHYGTPSALTLAKQDLTLTQDRSWTFTIDKGEKMESEMVLEAGKAVSRQLALVVIPEYDKYTFSTIAKAACNTANHYDTNSTALSKSNAYEKFLAGMEVLGNANAPDAGRVCLCSYGFANLLKQDNAFMRYGDASQAMITKGVIGEVDGCKIVKVPSSRLPSGCNFIITHPLACCAPKQLSEYKIHSDPPGMSGFLVSHFGQGAQKCAL